MAPPGASRHLSKLDTCPTAIAQPDGEPQTMAQFDVDVPRLNGKLKVNAAPAPLPTLDA
jgi:hypothetical protein